MSQAYAALLGIWHVQVFCHGEPPTSLLQQQHHQQWEVSTWPPVRAGQEGHKHEQVITRSVIAVHRHCIHILLATMAAVTELMPTLFVWHYQAWHMCAG
jgi:hypothetical protein